MELIVKWDILVTQILNTKNTILITLTTAIVMMVMIKYMVELQVPVKYNVKKITCL